MNTSFRCGHAFIPANFKWRARRRGENVRFYRVCRFCYAERMRKAATRRRVRQAEFREQLYTQFPQELPEIVSCNVNRST